MKKSEFRSLIREEIKKVLSEANSSSVSTATTLYKGLLKLPDVDDEAVDGEMETIIKKIGHTPEQKKVKGFYKFAFGQLPEFQTLADNQLTAVINFLKAVAKAKSFSGDDRWDGKTIVSED